jgi:ATP-dependent Lhr-like helicase
LPGDARIHPAATIAPAIAIRLLAPTALWTRDEAIGELLARPLDDPRSNRRRRAAESAVDRRADADAALLALESEGGRPPGHFEALTAESAANAEKMFFAAGFASSAVNRGAAIQWCERRLLARIHRYTLNRLRAEIEPVSPADFMRFLFAWQHVDAEHRLSGIDGLRSVLDQLDGFELAADGWERAVLPARVDGYDASMIDTLCLTGEVGWARLSAPTVEATQVVPATPVALFLRAHTGSWAALKGCATSTGKERSRLRAFRAPASRGP